MAGRGNPLKKLTIELGLEVMEDWTEQTTTDCEIVEHRLLLYTDMHQTEMQSNLPTKESYPVLPKTFWHQGERIPLQHGDSLPAARADLAAPTRGRGRRG